MSPREHTLDTPVLGHVSGKPRSTWDDATLASAYILLANPFSPPVSKAGIERAIAGFGNKRPARDPGRTRRPFVAKAPAVIRSRR